MTRVPRLQAEAAFLKWMRDNQPRAYQVALNQPGALAGVWDSISKTFTTITSNVAKLGTAYVEGRAAYDLMKANIARAKAGLLPANSLDEAAYDLQQRESGFGGIPQWAIYAGVGLIAFLIIRRR